MSTRSRPPRTPASAEPKPVMLRGTDFKCSRVNDLLQSASVGEKPARAVQLNTRGVGQPWHVARPHAVGVADDPKERDARELHLEVRLGEARAPEAQVCAGRVLTAEAPPAPRLERHLAPQSEDPAAVHAPELRVKANRKAGVMRRFEVAPADHRIEIPSGEKEARQGLNARVRGDELGARRAPEVINRLDPRLKAERRERIPPPAAYLHHDA